MAYIHKEFTFTSLDHWRQTYAAIVSYPDNYNPNRVERYPVFFLFHGVGEIPTPNQRINLNLIKNNIALYNRINSGLLDWTDAIFVQPQLGGGNGDSWSYLFLKEFVEVILGIRPVPTANQPTVPINGVVPLDGYQPYNIDRNKIHVAGISLGGEAITRLVANFPDDFFCTAVHFAGVNNDINTPAKARKVRYFYARHNQDDTVVRIGNLDNWETNLNAGGRLVNKNVIKPANGGHSGWNTYLNQSNQNDVTSPYHYVFSKSRLDYTTVDNNEGVPDPEPVQPPQISTLIPSDNSTGVLITTSNLTIQFSKNMLKGTGNIILNNTTDSISVNIPVSNTTIVGGNVTIPVTLLAGKGYNIIIPATAYKDTDNTPFAGILDSSIWNFTTKANVGEGPQGQIKVTITLDKPAVEAEVINKYSKNKFVMIQFDDNNLKAKDAAVDAKTKTINDGCGLEIPFKFSIALNGHNVAYNNQEWGTNVTKLLYADCPPLIEEGHDFEDHSDKHIEVPDLDTAISDININRNLWFNKIHYLMNSSVPPSNHPFYVQAWKNLNYLTSSTQGAKDGLPIYPNNEDWSAPVWQRQIGDLNNIPEGFAQLNRAFTESWTTSQVNSLKTLIDTLKSNSTESNNLFLIIGTHGYNKTNFLDFLSYLDNDFLVASVREIFEYKLLKENAVSIIEQVVNGNQITITYNYNKVPQQIRWKDLSFAFPNGYNIQNINVIGADNFSYQDNKFNIYKQKLEWYSTDLDVLEFVDQSTLPKENSPTNFIVNNIAKTGAFTNISGKTNDDTEITFDGGLTFFSNIENPFNVGNLDKAIGQVGVRYKAIKNISRASDWLFNQQPYTITSTTLVRIPIDDNRVWSSGNSDNRRLKGLSDNITPSDQPQIGYGIFYNPVEFWYDVDPDLGAIIKKFRYYDGAGSFASTPFKIYSANIVNNQIQKILLATITGTGYNQWFEITLEVAVTPRYLVFESTFGDGSFRMPTELEILGYLNENYIAPIVTPEVIRKPLRNLLGNPNGFVWNAMENAANPNDKKTIKFEKYNLIKQFPFFRAYMDWMEFEYSRLKYSYNPTARSGWYMDIWLEQMKSDGMEVLFSIQKTTPWLDLMYPSAQRDEENLPKNPQADGSRPESWLELAQFCFQVAARYGYTIVDTNLLSVDTTPRYNGADINEVKTGLGYVKYFSPYNEIDKTWKGAKAYLQPWEWGPFLSAVYDGHMGTMGNNVGFKTADPTCIMTIPGLASATPDVLFFVNLWSSIHRGYNEDGSVNLPFDVIDYHQYFNDGGGTQFSYATKGVAPELSVFKRDLERIRYFKQHILKQDKEIWLTETGYDVNQASPYHVPPVGNRSINQTLGDWSVRSALLGAEYGLSKINYYKWSADNINSGVTYQSSTGVFENTYTNRPVFNYLKAISDKFGYYTYVETITENPRVRKYVDNEGKLMFDIVSPTESAITGNYLFTIPFGINSIRLYNLQDNSIELSETILNPITGGVISIPYSEKVQFFTLIEGEIEYKGLSIISRKIPI